MTMTTIMKLENEHLRLVVNDDASGEVLDKATGQRWPIGPVAIQETGPVDEGNCWQRTQRSYCEQYPGRFRGVAEGDGVRFTLFGRQGREMGTFRACYRLDGPWLVVEVPEIDDSIPSLVFPPPLDSDSLVLPIKQGVWQRKPIAKFDHIINRFAGNGLNMRWFGGLREAAGWLGIFEEGIEDAGVLRAATRAAPIWLRSLGRWNSSRRMRYRFMAGGYVELAKAFRTWAREQGMFKTLAEKIAETPAVANIIGGRKLAFLMGWTRRQARYDERWQPVPPKPEELVRLFTYRQVAEIVADAKRLGMKRGAISLHGWIPGGYDETHPDVWPPEPAYGTLDELQALCAQPDPFVMSLHDNYQDIYEQSPSFPNGVCRMKDGSLLPGGFWRGGQAYILTAQAGLDYARRNWPQLATLGARSLYADTITAELLKESFAPGNTQTRRQDCAGKCAMMKFFKEQRLVFASEEGCDFGVPWLDWAAVKHERVPGESVPLWALVYHDCMVGYRDCAAGFSMESDAPVQFTGARARARCLENVLWGWANVLIGFTPQNWPQCRDVFQQSGFVDDWHGQIGTAEMIGHRFLTADAMVEQTDWSTGHSVIVNFATDPREVNGAVLAPQSYRTCG